MQNNVEISSQLNVKGDQKIVLFIKSSSPELLKKKKSYIFKNLKYLNQVVSIHEAKFQHFPCQYPHNAVELISTVYCHDPAS